MTVSDERKICNYSKYNSMSTEALEAILRQAPLCPEDGDFNANEIHYISQVVAERDKDTDRCYDVDASWETFKQKHLSSQGRTLVEKRRVYEIILAMLIAAVIVGILIGIAYAAEVFGWISEPK